MWVPIGSSAPCGLAGGGAGNGSREPRSGSFRGSGLGTSAARCASGSASPGRGARDRWDGSEAGRPSESAESRLFPARRLPPVLLPCGHAPRCPLTVWPLPPSTATAPGTPYSNTSRRVRDPATRTSASVPSLTLPFRLECLPRFAGLGCLAQLLISHQPLEDHPRPGRQPPKPFPPPGYLRTL